MLNKLEQNIVFHVYQHKGTINSQALATLCGVSKSTIRKEIILLNNWAQELGFYVEAKQSAGYRMIITQAEKAEPFFTKLKSDIRQNKYCNNTKVDKYYKVHYIIRRLLTASAHIRIDSLCDELYYSKSTIIRDLITVEEYLQEFRLELKTRREHGFYLEGSEWDKRLCLLFQHKIFVHLTEDLQALEKDFLNQLEINTNLSQSVRQVFMNTLQCYPSFSCAFIHTMKLVNYLILCKTRRKYENKITIEPQQFSYITKTKVYGLAQEVFRQLRGIFGFKESEAVVQSFSMLLLSFQSITSSKQLGEELYNELHVEVLGILNAIKQKYLWIDVLSDKDLLDDFTFNFYTFKNQLLFHTRPDQESYMPIENDGGLTTDLCIEYGRYLESVYNFTLMQSQIFSTFYLFNRLLDQSLHQILALRILVISIYGYNYGKFAAEKLYKTYAPYIQTIDVIEYMPSLDYKDYDLIITDSNNYHYWHTDMNHKDEIYKFIAKVNNREESDAIALTEKMMLHDRYLNAERNNMVVCITACDYEFYEPTLQILINKKTVLWKTMKSQFFLFYGYPKQSLESMFIIDSLLKFISQMAVEELAALASDEINIREVLLDKYLI